MKKITKYLLTILLTFTFTLSVHAASATISVSTNKSKVVVGGTFTVSTKISSSATLGSWEWTLDYDKSKFKLVSGGNVYFFSDYGENARSKTWTLKAIAKGSGTVTVKSAGAYDKNENKLSMNRGSKTVKVITQAELEASYSKDNTLKSLSVDGYDLSPSFSKDETNYKVEVPADTTKININVSKNDSKASVNGDGEHEVSEGENKFVITVTAENGSTKEYTVIVSVIDPNPITVKINDKDYVIVKRTSSIESKENFEIKEIEIDGQKVPSLFNESANVTLIALKDSEGNIKLYLYNEKDKSYKEYNEISLEKLKLLPLDIDKKFDSAYKEKTIKINDIEVKALAQKDSEYAIIKAKDLTNGKDNYYLYDSKNNTAIRYTDEMTISYKEKMKMYTEIIVFLGAETTIIIFILICILISKMRKNKRRKRKLLEEMKRKQEEIQKEEEFKRQEEKKLEELKNQEEKLEQETKKEIKKKTPVKKKSTTKKTTKSTKKTNTKKKDEVTKENE